MRKVLLVALLFAAPNAFAKTHHYQFKSPCSRVWVAVRQVLMTSGKYGILFLNDKDMMASYNIGGFMGGKRTNSAQLVPDGENCRMQVQTAFTGLAHDDAGDFHSRVKKQLAEVPAVVPSPSEPAEAGGGKASAEAEVQPASEATLVISSAPKGADIDVDGNFVGNTPSSVGVKPGEHTIKLSKHGYVPWERKVKTTTGKVNISAELQPVPENSKMQ
jgi:PEGA domain